MPLPPSPARSRSSLVALVAALGLCAAAGACSSSPTVTGSGGNVGAGGGGHPASGGNTGSGGQGGAAGTPGTAGTTSTGGATGTGGVTATGGATAGTTGMAGATGTAGMAGTTGMGGTTGTAGTIGHVPVKHRPAAVACPMERPASTCVWASMPDAGVTLMCSGDADCTAGTNGRCDPIGRANGCSCSYDQCFADTDCKTTTGPCECRPRAITAGQAAGPTATPINSCKAGNCRVDKDCGGGAGFCSPTLGPCGTYGGLVGYYCHTPQDKCTDDTDCAAQGGGDCRYDQVSAAWTCQKGQCAG